MFSNQYSGHISILFDIDEYSLCSVSNETGHPENEVNVHVI